MNATSPEPHGRSPMADLGIDTVFAEVGRAGQSRHVRLWLGGGPGTRHVRAGPAAHQAAAASQMRSFAAQDLRLIREATRSWSSQAFSRAAPLAVLSKTHHT